MAFNDDPNYQHLIARMDSWYYGTDIKEANEEENEINSEIFWKIVETPDVMLEIFSRVPPKYTLRYKFVSKTFLDFANQKYFISKLFDTTRDNIMGFFGQESMMRFELNPDSFDGIKYLHVNSELNLITQSMVNFVTQSNNDEMVRLIDSCNGLLLCININTKSANICFVCNPFTREKVVLAHSRRRSSWVNHALMADLNKKGYLKYKVVCLFKKKGQEPGTQLSIFSSVTGEWEEINADFPTMHHPATMMGSKVFFNRSLFWDCFESRILVCHLDKKRSGPHYELIEAPCGSLGRCLWKFNENLICYCHDDENKIPVWSLSTKDNGEFEWKIEESERFAIMFGDITTRLPIFRRKIFKILGHDPVLDIVYFLQYETIFSYQYKNREVDVVGRFDYECPWRTKGWRWMLDSNTFVVDYRHTMVQIQASRKGIEKVNGDR